MSLRPLNDKVVSLAAQRPSPDDAFDCRARYAERGDTFDRSQYRSMSAFDPGWNHAECGHGVP